MVFYYAVFEGVTLNIDPAAKLANNRLLLLAAASLLSINEYRPAKFSLFSLVTTLQRLRIIIIIMITFKAKVTRTLLMLCCV